MRIFEFHRGLTRGLLASLLLIGTIVPLGAQAADETGGNSGAGDTATDRKEGKALRVEGIAIRAADESPRVLHILPWQPPTIRRNEREALSPRADNLLEPVNPEAFRYHRAFRRTLDPGQLSEQ